jgi:LmbE family N-acetylglucosaminyl deacetylase
MDPDEYAEQKREEARACADVLGAELWIHDYKDGELVCDDAVKLDLAKSLRESKPKTVITHWRGSIHKDHQNTADLFPDAGFYSAIRSFDLGADPHWVPSVYYGENWEDLRGYEPEIWLEITDEDIEVWEEAMRCYALFRGEWKTFEYLEYYKALARSRGCEFGSKYAVSFALPPGARRQRLKSLL